MALIDQLGAVDPEGVVSGLIADTAPDLVQNNTVDPQSVMNRLIRKGLDSRQQRALERSQNQPGPEQAPADLSAFGKTKDEVDAGAGDEPKQDFSTFGQTEDEIKPKKDEWGGYGSVIGRAGAKGAVEGTGHVLKGVGGLLQPPDEPADMGPNGGGPKLDATDLVPKKTTQPQLTNPQNPISRAGHAVSEYADKNIPLSPTEADSITGRTARAVGGFLPFAAGMAAGGALGGPPGAIAVGAGVMAASSGSAAYDEAIAKGADDATAAKAAGLNAIVGGALGVLPLGVILAPFRATAPGLVGLAATALEKALRAGIVFSTVGEAQEYLGQQIAKALYDPNAGYSPDAKRIISSFVAGGIIGAATPPYRAPGPAPGPAPGAGSTAGALPGGGGPGGGPGAGPRGPGERPTGNPRADDPYDPNFQWSTGKGKFSGTWYRDDPAGTRWYYDPSSAQWNEAAGAQGGAGTGPQGFRTSPGGPGGPTPGAPPPPFESTLRPKLRKVLEAKAAYYKEHSAEDIASWSDDKLKDYVNTKFGGGSAKSEEAPAESKAEKPKTYKPMDEAEAESTLREFGYDDEYLGKMGAETRRATAEMLRTAYPDGPPKGKAKAEQPSTGTREDPVEVKSAEDVARAAAAASTDHSHEQGEANNRKLGHIEWKGLEGSIEVAAGGTRKGTNPETGERWETTHTVPYGYFKGTVGGDGMHVDAYWGPDLEKDHPVYVLDEVDKDTGKFRQTKTFVGFADPGDALKAYLGTSSKTRDQIGGMRALSVDEFKKWVMSPAAKESISEALANGKIVPKARADKDARVQALEERQGSVQQPEKPVLSQLRETGDQDTSAVGEGLRGVPGRGRAEAVAGSHAGTDQKSPGVHSKQPPLGDQEGTGAQHAQERVPDLSGENAGDTRVGAAGGPSSVHNPLSAEPGHERSGSTDNAAAGRPATGHVDTRNKVSNEAGTSGADKAMADLASMFNEPTPEHHAAVETAVKATGHDPARMRPADMRTAAELIANHGMSPEHAFMVAVAHNLIADGTIKFKDAEQVLGHEQATELLEIGNHGEQRQPSAEAPGAATGGAAAPAAEGVGPGGAENGRQVPASGTKQQPEHEAHGGERPGEQESVPAADATGAETGRGAVGETTGGQRNAEATERGAGEAGKPAGEAAGGAERKNAGAAEGAVKKRPTKTAASVLEFVGLQGGLKPTPELRDMGLNYTSRVMVAGVGYRNLVRKNGGLDTDQLVERLREGGYLPENEGGRPDAHGVQRKALELISGELRGRKAYPLGEIEPQATHVAEENAERESLVTEARKALQEALNEAKIPLDSIGPEIEQAAIRLMLDEDKHPLAALDDAVLWFEREHDYVTADDERQRGIGIGEEAFRALDERPAPEAGQISPAESAKPAVAEESHGAQARGSASGAGESVPEKPEPQSKPAVEPGVEGKPQLVIPGAEKISSAELAQRRANEGLKPKTAQKPPDEGLFGDGHKQTDLLDVVNAKARETGPSDSATRDTSLVPIDEAKAVVAKELGPEWDAYTNADNSRLWVRQRNAKALSSGIVNERAEFLDTVKAMKKSIASERRAASASEKVGKIEDFGEKIGGARKDLAGSTGERPKAEKPEVERPTWAKRFTIQEVEVKSSTDGETGKRWEIHDARTGKPLMDPNTRWKPRTFASKEEAEQVLPLAAVALKHRVVGASDNTFKIIRDVTERKRVTIKDGFPDRDAAMRYLHDHAVEILETKTGFGEEILAAPEKVKRQGAEHRKGDVDEKDFGESFGFRGVEFGNWNNQAERQEVMNHAYDGLRDLADLLNIPPKALSLDGQLAIAFGARGHGLSGARAHYERDYGVINLTKMSGAGSLAHEWMHALDAYLARRDTKSSSAKVRNERGDEVYDVGGTSSDYISHGAGYKSKLRDELKAALKHVSDTIATKAETYVEDTEQADKWLNRAKERLGQALNDVRADLAKKREYGARNVAPADAEQLARFDALAEKLRNGDDIVTSWRMPTGGKGKPRHTNDTVDALSALYKEVRGRAGFNDGQGPIDRIVHAINDFKKRLTMMEEAALRSEKTRRVPTQFARDAYNLDQGRSSDYWSTPHELIARAMSSYVEDKIAERGGRSDFLSYGSDNAFYRIFNARPFPEGVERTAINGALDQFFSTLKAEEGSKPGSLALSEPENRFTAPTFYSAVGRAVDGAKQEKASPNQWLGILKNTHGVKPEEIEWLGLDDWLREHKGPVTKQAIADYVRANQTEVKEITKGGNIPSPTVDAIAEWLRKEYGEADREAEITPADLMRLRQGDADVLGRLEGLGVPEELLAPVYAGLDENNPGEQGSTKFGKWVLPGGENYRELLLTLPPKPVPEKPTFRVEERGPGNWSIMNPAGELVTTYGSEAYARSIAQDWTRDGLPEHLRGREGAGDYRGSHWDEPNVLAHVRFNDRTIDGKKTLFIEEVQSDWHQAGKRRGYTGEQHDIPAIDAEIDERARADGGMTVPDAPFKTTWPELAMKRMIRYAAEHGYDAVAWTPGEVQADRYALSKQIDRLYFQKNQDGTFDLSADTRNGDGAHLGSAIPEAKLADHVGKEVADRILERIAKSPDLEPTGSFEQIDLKVGGEGMLGFYDDILPSAVNKMVKKFGAKAGMAKIETPGGIGQWEYRGHNLSAGEINARQSDNLSVTVNRQISDIADQVAAGQPLAWAVENLGSRWSAEALGGQLVDVAKPISVHSIDIVSRLRDAALSHGFPLFDPGAARRGAGFGGPKQAGPFRAEKGTQVARQAQEYVVSRGRANGIEHLVAIDADGNAIGDITGHARKVDLTPELEAALLDPKQSIVIHHNHPSNAGLSNPDIAQVAMPGVAAIWAHGQEGRVTRVAATEAMRKILSLEGSPVGNRTGLLVLSNHLSDRFFRPLKEAAIDGLITAKRADDLLSHMIATTLHRGGVIDYFSNEGFEHEIADLGLESHIETAAQGVAGSMFHERARPAASLDRPARPVLRHPGDVGTLLGGVGKTAGRPERLEGGANRARSEGDRREASQQLSLPGFSQPGPRFRQPTSRYPVAETIAGWLEMGNHSKLAGISSALHIGKINAAELRVKLQDKFLRWKRAEEAVARETGRSIPEQMQPYLAESLYAGRTGERLERLDEHHIDPLIDDIKKRGLTLEDVDKFLMARHAPERNAALRKINPSIADPSGMSDADARAFLQSIYNSPKRGDYGAIEKRVRALIDETRNNLVRDGLLSQEAADKWKAAYKHYVPLRGWAEGEAGDFGTGTGRGFDVRGPESKQALGRSTVADSPLGYVMMQAQQAIVRGEKNRVAQTALRFVKNYPDPGIWKVDKGDIKRVIDSDTGLVKEVHTAPNPETSFGVKVAGVPHYINFQGQYGADLARALNNLGTANMGGVMRFFGMLTRTLARLSTSWNPDFMVPNFVRDAGEALINLQGQEQKSFVKNFAKHLVPAVRGAFNALRGADPTGKYTKAFKEFDAAGGRIRFFGMENVEDIKANIESKMRRLDGGVMNSAKVAAEKAVSAIEIANGAIENATRLAAFMAARDVGLSPEKSASIARELTVNFNRKGELGTAISSLYMFANAAMQGSARMLTAMGSKRSRHFAYALAAAGASLALYNIAIGGDDDDGVPFYMKIAPWERDGNLILMWPKGIGMDGHYIKLPLPYGYSFFAVIGARMAGLSLGKEKAGKAFSAMAKSVLDAFDPLGKDENLLAQIMPTVAKPAVHLSTNENWTGRPINPKPEPWNKHEPDSSRSFRNASEFSKKAAEKLNSVTGGTKHEPGYIDISPGTIDYALGFVGGGLGRFAMNLTNTIVRGVRGQEWDINKTPILHRFAGKVDDNASRALYFEAREEAQTAHDRMQAYSKDKVKNPEAMKRFREDNQAELSAYNKFKSVDDKRRQLAKDVDVIKADEKLSAAERDAKIKVKQKEELKLMADARKRLDDVRKEQKKSPDTNPVPVRPSTSPLRIPVTPQPSP